MNNLREHADSKSEQKLGNPPSQCALRRTLPGEYLALALMLHAGLGSMVWAVVSVRASAGLLLVTFGLWIVCRAAGAFSRRVFAPFVTAGLLIAALTLRQQGFDLPTPALVVFSLPVYIAMLGVVFLFDLVELTLPPFERA